MGFTVAIEFFLLGVNFQFLMKFLLLKSNVEYIRALKIAKFSFFANYSRRGLCLMSVNTFLLPLENFLVALEHLVSYSKNRSKNQRKNVPEDKKLYLHDIKRVCKNIKHSIFDDTNCCLWGGYITNLNKANKGTYINFYFRLMFRFF